MPTEPNWLDRAIAWASPKRAVRRQQARMALELLSAYEGAAMGRRTEGWITSGSDANTAIGMDLPKLRDRSRDLIRNTPEGKKIKRTILTHCIGTGIVPEADTGNDALDKKINDAFQIHLKECDADGQLDYFGLQALAVSGIIESGETLARRRSRRPSDGLYVPLQYQILESDHLDHTRYEGKNAQGGVTVQGVVRDAIGRRAGYWLFPSHPGSSVSPYGVSGSFVSKFYDAADIVHVYPKAEDRPGQERGVPFMSSIIRLMRDMDEYNDAEIVRAKVAACLSVFIEQDAQLAADSPNIGSVSTDQSTGDRIEKVRPGMYVYGRPGETAKPIIPTGHANFAEFAKYQQHRQAMGAGLFYPQFSTDLSAVNWSSYRAGDRDFKAFVELLRWLCVIPMMLEPMWEWFIDAAYLAGRIPEPNYGVLWTPPQFMSVNPLADAQSDEYELASGLTEWGESVRRRGFDPEKQYQKILKWKQRMSNDGLVMAWDRSQVSASGVVQPDTNTPK